MKKLLFLLLGAAVAVSASANPLMSLKDSKRAVKVMPQTAMSHQLKMRAEVPGALFDYGVKKMSDASMSGTQKLLKRFNAPNRANAEADIITTQPEGELRTYVRTGASTYLTSSSSLVYDDTTATNVSIVFAPDGETVYIQNPVTEFATGAWAKGTISGNKITLPLGQPMAWSDNYNTSLMLAWGTASGTYFYYNSAVTEATYTIDGNTITLDNTSADVSDETIMGLAIIWEDDHSWQRYIDGNTVYTLAEDAPATPTVLTDNDVMALDGTLNSYVRTGGATVYDNQIYLMDQYDYAYIFFASDGETVYMRNPIYGLTLGTWVKGTVNGDKITIPTGQYLYYSSTNNYGLVTSWGSLKPEATSDTTSTLNYTPDNAVTEVTYTISGNTVTMDNTPGTSDSEIIGLSAIWDDDLSWMGFFDWSTVYNLLPNPVVAATPADPEALEWHDSEAEEGESYFAYSFPLKDTDGNTLDPKYISYSIYTDEDEIFTFDVNTYAADTLESDLTEIPVGVWGGSYDFANNVTYFYRTNTGDNPMFDWRIGIQVHYTVDGVKNSSNIVYLEVFPQQTVLRGDVNRDGSVSIADVTTLIDHLLSNDFEDSENFSYANSLINEDETVSIADVTALIDLLLAGGN